MPEPPKYPRPSDEEMASLLASVLEECPDLSVKDDEKNDLVQEVVGLAMQFAGKWNKDIEQAGIQGDGKFGAATAAEMVAYGALSVIFQRLEGSDVRKALHAAGKHVGNFMVDRWEANQRQSAFHQAQGDPD